MDRKKLIKSDAYWVTKLQTMLYHKNYKDNDRRKQIVNELLELKKELIEVCEGDKQTSDDSVLNLCGVSNNAVAVCSCGNKLTDKEIFYETCLVCMATVEQTDC